VTLTAGTGRLGAPDDEEGAAAAMTGPPTDENAVSALIVDTGSLVEFAVTLGSLVPPGALDGLDVKGTRERGRWLACEDEGPATELTGDVPGILAATGPLPLITPWPALGLVPTAAGAPGFITVVPAGPETLVLGT
jgi:hypothetical protein